jgi:hypothetical protein
VTGAELATRWCSLPSIRRRSGGRWRWRGCGDGGAEARAARAHARAGRGRAVPRARRLTAAPRFSVSQRATTTSVDECATIERMMVAATQVEHGGGAADVPRHDQQAVHDRGEALRAEPGDDEALGPGEIAPGERDERGDAAREDEREHRERPAAHAHLQEALGADEGREQEHRGALEQLREHLALGLEVRARGARRWRASRRPRTGRGTRSRAARSRARTRGAPWRGSRAARTRRRRRTRARDGAALVRASAFYAFASSRSSPRIRYSVFRSIPRTSAARVLLPPCSASTCAA